MVVFGAGVSSVQAFAAVAETDSRIIWTDEASRLLLIDRVSFANAVQLYRRGALMVGSGPFAGSCLFWIRT